MKLLITGINGFVGSNFTQKWKDKYTLYGLDINQEPKEGVEAIFSWEEMDKIPQVDCIIHLAGKAHDTKNKSEAQVYFDVNTGLTRKIFDYFLESKAKKFVFFSSVKAAADVVEDDILTEEVIPKPKGPYGESKIKAENYILSKKEEYEAKSKKVYIIRPTMIHGPGNKGNLNLLYRLVQKGIPWPLAAFENNRSFLSVDNLIFIVEQLLEKDVSSDIYHVADDERISTNQLIELMATSLAKKPRFIRIPQKLVHLIAKTGDGLHLPLNSERLQKLTENYVVSNQKIKTVLNIKNLPLSAQDGLLKTLKSFQQHDSHL